MRSERIAYCSLGNMLPGASITVGIVSPTTGSSAGHYDNTATAEASKAREAATRVRKTGRQEALDPMSAFERKIVHDAVAEVGGLETASEGEEPNRRVVIRRAAR